MLSKDDSRDGVMLKLALATGARAQEILNLTGADLDESSHSVYIRGLKNSNDRDIPVDKVLFAQVKALADKSQGRIFAISYPRLVVIWEFYRPVKKKFHSIRHTFAIELYRRTKDLLLVQAALGHRNIQNSLVYTTHLYQTEMLKNVLEKSA